MRRLFLALAFCLIGCASAISQTTINLSVTDTPDNQTWNNGTWSVQLIPGAGSSDQTRNFTLLSGGGSLTSQSGSLSTTGTASFSLPANVNIGPSGTRWQFTVCSQAATACSIANITVTTSSPQSVTISPPSIRVAALPNLPPIIVYTTTEISSAGIGAQITVVGTTPSTPLLQSCTAVSGNACTTWGSVGGSVGGPSYILASASGVVGNGKFCADGTVTNGSPNISSAGQCQWTSADVGSFIFVTNACNSSQCGFINLPASQTILPSTQTKIARISSVTDATHIVADCNSPANCVSPNASATNTGFATIFYAPTKQTTQVNNAFALQQNTTGCPVLIYPQGMILIDAGIWNTIPANSSCVASVAAFKSLQQVLTQNGGGPVVKGAGGMNGTVFVMSPDFNFTCPSSGCIGNTNNGGDYEDFTVTGLGQNFFTSGFQETELFSCYACVIRNVTLSGWMNRVANTAGVGGAGGFMYLDNVQIIAFGSQSGCIQVQGDGNILKSVIAGLCGGPALAGNGSANVQSSNSLFYGGNPNNSAQIDTTGMVHWQSTNDRIFSTAANTAASDDIKIAATTTATIINLFNPMTGANSNGIEVVSGGSLRLGGYLTSGGKNKGLTIAGTFTDLGGNDSTYGSATNTCTGTCFGSASQTATTSAATNFGVALTAQNVDVVAPSGPVTVNMTINQSLAGVGCGAGSNTATPTLSWTAPGGTAKTLALTALSVSANGAVDTFQNDTTNITAQPGTTISYTMASVLASAGCSTIPQYTAFAKVTQ